MKIALGVANRVGRICIAGFSLSLGAWGCGDSKSNSDPVTAGAGGEDTSMSGSGGSDDSSGSGTDAGNESPFEDPFPDDILLPDQGPCTPGDTRACTFDLLCTGTQTCNGQGNGFGECDCGGAVLENNQAIVGMRCETNVDCTNGAICFPADSDRYLSAGGPAGGYCTYECTQTSECVELDPQSLCGPFGEGSSRHCIRTCESKDPEAGEAKCLNRPDLVCLSIAANGEGGFSADRQPGVCVPRCGSDSECPDGRVCHLQGGICTLAQIGGSRVGARCELRSDCAGECENRDDEGIGTCTSRCTLGSLAGCGYSRDASEREAGCLTPLVSVNGFSEGPGDVGLCRELCDEAADCQRSNEGWICRSLSASAAQFFGRAGACSPPTP